MDAIALDSIVPRLYDAVGNPDEWSSILDDVSATFDMAGASVFSGDEVQIELNHVFMSALLTRNIPVYLANGFNEVDARSYKLVKTVGKKLSFESEFDLYSRATASGYDQPRKLDSLRSWLKTIGIEERFLTILEASPGFWSFMAFHSGYRGRMANTQESKTLLHHVARIVRINRPFLLLNNRFNAVFEVIDRFHLGVLVLDPGNRIVLANTAAETMLDDADGIRRAAGGMLQGCLEGACIDLKRAAGKLCMDLVSQQSTVEFSIPRMSGKIDYVAEMSLLSSKVLDSCSDHRLLVITDPERDDIVSLSGIKKIYRLSEAEESVAQRMVTGTSYKEIAEFRGVSPDTVKVQVASILRKTGCKNRTELVCLAHKATIPVDQLQ